MASVMKAKKMSRNDNVNDDDDGLRETKFCLKLVCLTFYYYSRGYFLCTHTYVRTSAMNKKEENCLFKFNENKQVACLKSKMK